MRPLYILLDFARWTTGKRRDVEGGAGCNYAGCKKCTRQYFFTKYMPESVCGIKGEGTPVLVLAFLCPLFWVLDAFW